MDFQALADFNLVASHGGFGRASRASGVSKATLSRRIRELEVNLGVRLIERGTHSLRLTSEGELLRTKTESLMVDIVEAGKDVVEGNSRPRGKLRVSAPLFFANVTLGKLAAGFFATYPEVQLEVTTEDRFVDLVEDGYDLVIRVNPKNDTSLVGRCFLRDRLVLIASPGMERPAQVQADDTPIPFPAIVRAGVPTAATWTVIKDEQEFTYHPQPVMWSSAPVLVRDAVREGAGAALVPHSVAAADLAAGNLVSWGYVKSSSIEAWALHASRRLVSPKVSAFVQYLCDFYADISFKGF